MAQLELTTNLKLISSTLTTPPTTTQLPLGYMAFGLVNGRASIWGNYDGTVHDLVAEGTVQVTIVQTTGQSTTAVMSQKAVTDELTTMTNTVAGINTRLETAESDIDNLETAVNGLGTASTKDVGTAAGNVPELDSNGKLPTGVLPAIAITDTFVVNSQAAMLALTAQVGDVAVRTDNSRSYILKQAPASTLANWQELLSPGDAVLSVNGKTGTVVIGSADITSTFTQATTRANLSSGETLAVSLGKISKWFADLKGLAFKDKIVATTDITGVIPEANLPTASASTKGIASFAGNTFTVLDGEVSLSLYPNSGLTIKEETVESTYTAGLAIQVGNGIKVDANGVSADIVLKIATI